MPHEHDFTWIDGERLIRFAPGALAEAPELLRARGFDPYVLLTTERAETSAPHLADGAADVLHVPRGGVPEAAATVRDQVRGRPMVALGGGRVIDAAKAIAGADGLDCAAVPTTLSGAELTRIHRMPAGVDRFTLVRPSLVVVEPLLMASQPLPDVAASAINAVSHAAEATYTPLANPVADISALRGIAMIARALSDDEIDRPALALGSILSAWALGTAGYAVGHVICQTLVRVTGIEHSQAYSVMLPHTLGFVAPRAPGEVGRIAEALGADAAAAGLASPRAREVAARAAVSTLGELGVTEEQVPEVVSVALGRAELANTPGGPPSEQELTQLVRGAL